MRQFRCQTNLEVVAACAQIAHDAVRSVEDACEGALFPRWENLRHDERLLIVSHVQKYVSQTEDRKMLYSSTESVERFFRSVALAAWDAFSVRL